MAGGHGDVLTMADVAKTVTKLKMYPYFDIANYILMCMMVREDDRPPPSSDGQVLSRRHPLASWVSSMLMCFSSVIIVNLILGEPPITPFTNQRDMITATAVWYAINYSPFDLVYKSCKFFPFHVIIYCMKEIQRAGKVHHGVHFASKVYPDDYVIICIVGVLKGAGYYYMRIFERLVRGTWIPSSNEILQPTLATKACLLASLLFIFDDEGMLDIGHHELYLAVVAIFIVGRLLYLVLHVHNPFALFENIVCTLFFGGLVDAVRRVVASKPTTTSSVSSTASAGAGNKPDGSSMDGGGGQPSSTGGVGSGGQQGTKSKEE